MKLLNQYIYLAVLTLFCSASFADKNATEIVKKFMRDTVELRLGYFYKNRFCKVSDKENLYRLAKEAGGQLDTIISTCRLEKEQIEEYPGDDWDMKFGVTGLWRQAASDLDNAILLKSKIDYYADLSHRAATVMERPNNDFEGNVIKAFERLRTGDDSKLNAVIERWPETKYFFAKIVLDCLDSSGDIENLTLLEAKLAASAALASEPGRYREILTALARIERFAEPTIFYAAAAGCVDSEPNLAIEFFTKASRFDSPIALGCAAEAARVAYKLYNSSKADCLYVISVFENYVNIVNTEIDETLEYCYSRILGDCGQSLQAMEVLKKIAGRDNGQFAHRAEFELISSNQEENKTEQLGWLIDKISNSEPVDKQLRYEVIAAYCREQLALAELNNALEVIDVLETMEQKDCRLGEYILVALSKITERIDEYELPPPAMQNCYNIALDYYNCFQSQQKAAAGIFCAELGTFLQNRADPQRFLDDLTEIIDENDIDILRCKARLLMTKGQYSQAALLWAGIADSKKSLTKADYLSNWQWWRGKYYELYCASKINKADVTRIRHSTEVLLYSSTDIPTFWKEKLMEICTEKL